MNKKIGRRHKMKDWTWKNKDKDNAEGKISDNQKNSSQI